MPYSLDNTFVSALSSRALFDLEEENRVFEAEGEEAYEKYQLDRLDSPAEPGVAFSLVRKLLAFNTPAERRVEVVVLSRNDPVSGLRVFRSASHHGLDITRGAFTGGQPPWVYLHALQAAVFLSANERDVRMALEAGIPAARVYAKPTAWHETFPQQVRIAFDGDSVLFADEAERVFKEQGLAAFHENERVKAREPLPPGPFKPFLVALHRLQAAPTDTGMTIRTALVTARDAPAHDRAIRTLMSWDVKVDEAFFLGGLDKANFLAAFQPDFFFDDQTLHCESAATRFPTGHVAYGIANLVGRR